MVGWGRVRGCERYSLSYPVWSRLRQPTTHEGHGMGVPGGSQQNGGSALFSKTKSLGCWHLTARCRCVWWSGCVAQVFLNHRFCVRVGCSSSVSEGLGLGGKG